MENRYHELIEQIRPPEELYDRVVCAARKEQTVAGKRRSHRRPLLRVAVCAACAVALVLGTVTFRGQEEIVPEGGQTITALPAVSFGLTAYAADTGERMGPNVNGGLAFRADGEGSYTERDGYYTGCMFQVTGKNIASVSLSIDRGGLYRYQMHTDLTDEEITAYRQAMAEGTLAAVAISQAEDGTWYMPEMTALGSNITEEYDPEVGYGFWVPGVDTALWQEDLRTASHESIDILDGAQLMVEVTFTDGSTQAKTYTLSTGKLRLSQESHGHSGTLLLPSLAGDDKAYLYGVYAESETESRFLSWPVQGAETVRLSAEYDNAGRLIHTGIDIPAAAGTPVLAAADGTVAEIGFDAEQGHYIVLDHGGGLTTSYGQCRDILADLAEGDPVTAGEMIAAVGSTGMSTGAHLHFQVLLDGQTQDPVAYFDSTVRDTLRMA